MNCTIEVKTPHDGLRASLEILLQHCADFHIRILDIISTHYKIDKDEMINIVQNHPLYKNMLVHPVIPDILNQSSLPRKRITVKLKKSLTKK
jgi:hypothetical protein